MPKGKKRVSIPNSIVDALKDANEVKIDVLGRVRGFDIWLERELRRQGRLK